MRVRVFVRFVLVCALIRESTEINVPSIYDALTAIERVLNFVNGSSENVYADLLLGVVMTEGQLNVVKRNLNINTYITSEWKRHPLIEFIESLEIQCQSILNATREKIIIKNDEVYKNLVREVLRAGRWAWAAPARALRGRGRRGPGDARTRAGAPPLRVLRQGRPDERASDACLGEVLGAAGGPPCAASPRCLRVEVADARPRARGYPLTHRLLYAQMARQSGCTFLGTPDEVEDIVDDLCSDILIDTELIERLDFPIYARDVFCEQVALCGIEGFFEFMRPAWIKRILSWQRPVGCYGNEVEFQESVKKVKYERLRRRKRDDGVMAHGCLMHFTGVALAALAASLRYLAENDSVNGVFLT